MCGRIEMMVCAVVMMAAFGTEATESRMDRAKLQTGTYYLHPVAQTEAHVKAMKDCPEAVFGAFMSANGVKNVGSVTRAVNRLKEEDLVYEFAGEWKFTNPFFREWLNAQV